jgi:hypothetical protein
MLHYFYPDIIHPGVINRGQDNLMIQIPVDLAKLYTPFMEQKGVETDQHRYYIKRKQAHHAASLFYEMGHLSGRKTRNGTSYGKSAAYGHTEPEISSSHTKKVAFNQAVFSGRKIIPQTSKPGSDTNMAPGQSGSESVDSFNRIAQRSPRGSSNRKGCMGKPSRGKGGCRNGFRVC